jgi:hypothetical protein
MADSKRSGDAKKAKSKVNEMNPVTQSSDSLRQTPQPEWASGLKRLYNSVVEEPLPDSFADLIAKLDVSDS